MSPSSSVQIRKLPLVAVMIFGSFIAILNQTLLVTAVPSIMYDFGISANTAQWLVTIFMLVNGIMIPITAFLIETFSTRKLFMFAMGGFALGTLLCAIAPNYSVLVIGRIVQAAGAGVMMPLVQTVFFIIFPKEKRGTAMGLFGLVISFAPAIGPVLSGWVVDHFSWRILFYMVLPIALIDLVFAYFILKNVTRLTHPKVDPWSIALSTLGFGGILYGFGMAGSVGWGSLAVIGSLLVGGISLLLFVRRQLKLKQPMLEFRVFRYPIFALTTGISIVVFMSMIGAATILPIYMQDMQHVTALKSGLALLPGAVLMGLMSPVSGRIFDKFGARGLSITGLTIVTVTTLMLTRLAVDTSFLYIAIVYAVRTFGLSLVMTPVTTAGINDLPVQLIPHGTAMSNTMRQVSASIGTALLVTVMTATVTDADAGVAAAIRGVNNAFIVSAVLAAIGMVLTFFVRGTKPSTLRERESAPDLREPKTQGE